jgi:hypothetical protein
LLKLAVKRDTKEGTMADAIRVHHVLAGVGRFLGHTAAVVVGLMMMIVGLGLGVTMIMLPLGIAIGLLGVAVLVAGLFAHIDETRGWGSRSLCSIDRRSARQRSRLPSKPFPDPRGAFSPPDAE